MWILRLFIIQQYYREAFVVFKSAVNFDFPSFLCIGLSRPLTKNFIPSNTCPPPPPVPSSHTDGFVELKPTIIPNLNARNMLLCIPKSRAVSWGARIGLLMWHFGRRWWGGKCDNVAASAVAGFAQWQTFPVILNNLLIVFSNCWRSSLDGRVKSARKLLLAECHKLFNWKITIILYNLKWFIIFCYIRSIKHTLKNSFILRKHEHT